MAPPHNHLRLSPLPLPLPFSTEHRPRRCSKAQMSFFNILHIISVFPTADVTDNNRLTHNNEICNNRELVVDVNNIRLLPPPEATAVDAAVGENCVFENNDRRESESCVADASELAVEEERATATEHSEISHVGDQSSGGVDNNNGDSERKPRDEGYLGLLIEAAQLIDSVSDQDLKPSKTSKITPARATATARGGAKRKAQCWTAAAEAEWYAEFEEASPVVKSKRGRNQVLPYKYRDSVVEPLVRWSPAISNAVVSSRRRSK